MVSNSTIIERDAQRVWNIIEAEFSKTFNCDDKELLGQKLNIQTRNYVGNAIQVSQEVIEYKPGQSIAIQSGHKKDIVINKYVVEPLEANSTRVTLSVKGKNQGSLLRTWNYWLMSLPIFRSGTKKRLEIQLGRLKEVIEKGDGKA